MNSTELAVLRQRCDRGETFTAEEVEYLVKTLESVLDEVDIGCEFCAGFGHYIEGIEDVA